MISANALCGNLADTECALATKAPVDSFGPSQTGDTGDLPAQVTFEGWLPWNEAAGAALIDSARDKVSLRVPRAFSGKVESGGIPKEARIRFKIRTGARGPVMNGEAILR